MNSHRAKEAIPNSCENSVVASSACEFGTCVLRKHQPKEVRSANQPLRVRSVPLHIPKQARKSAISRFHDSQAKQPTLCIPSQGILCAARHNLVSLVVAVGNCVPCVRSKRNCEFLCEALPRIVQSNACFARVRIQNACFAHANSCPWVVRSKHAVAPHACQASNP